MLSRNSFVNSNFGFFSSFAQGQAVWLPLGTTLLNNVKQLIRKELRKKKYREVETPTICSNVLWAKTGHLAKFKQNMFLLDGCDCALKPMNCPMHAQVFKTIHRREKKLPIKLFEFANCFRNESTGALNGLFRLIKFTQDDSHVFCSIEQTTEVVVNFIEALKRIYFILGFKLDKVTLSTTDTNLYIGNVEQKNKAESLLKEACRITQTEATVTDGEGAFYGPKLDFHLVDAQKRQWQCGTVQVDLCMPTTLNLNCEAVIHHAILGTFERFIGIMLDNQLPLPFIINPVKLAVISVRNTDSKEAEQFWLSIKERLKKVAYSAKETVVDFSNRDISEKIRKCSSLKPSYVLIIGNKEIKNNSVSLRENFGCTVELGVDEFIKHYTNKFNVG